MRDDLTKRKKDPVWIYISGLITAGVFHLIEYNSVSPVSTLMFCLIYLIYTGLILMWIFSINSRLLPSREKDYLITAAFLMVLYLMIRTIKYRAVSSVSMNKYLWFAYYIPFLFIAGFFLITAIRISRRIKNDGMSLTDKIIIAIDLILCVLIMTNDLHYLIWHPDTEGAVLTDRNAVHGLLFYGIYLIIGLEFISGIILLIHADRKHRSFRKLLWPGFFVALFILLALTQSLIEDLFGIAPYNLPEICIFTIIGFIESCIRTGLIPSNNDYEGFFSQMSIPAEITDNDLNMVYVSAHPVETGSEGLKTVLDHPVKTGSLKLEQMPIRAGHVFWAKDESLIDEYREKLSEANETIGHKNDLIVAENELQERKARIESRNRIYSRIAQEMYPAQKELERLLGQSEPDDLGEVVSRASVLNAYIKRKTNLLLIGSEEKEIDVRELALALKESVSYLKYCGIGSSFINEADGMIDVDEAVNLYDAFEFFVEHLIGKASQLIVTLGDDELRFVTDTKDIPSLNETGLGTIIVREEDITYVTVKGGVLK